MEIGLVQEIRLFMNNLYIFGGTMTFCSQHEQFELFDPTIGHDCGTFVSIILRISSLLQSTLIYVRGGFLIEVSYWRASQTAEWTVITNFRLESKWKQYQRLQLPLSTTDCMIRDGYCVGVDLAWWRIVLKCKTCYQELGSDGFEGMY